MRRVPVKGTSYVNRWGTLVIRRAHGRNISGSNGGTPPPHAPYPPPAYSPPPSSEPSPSRRRKRRRLTVAVTVAVALGVGAVTIDLSTSGKSANSSNAITVQANLDLKLVVAKLLKLRFAGTSMAQPTGSDSGCAQDASGDVKQFLTLHPCKDSALSSITMHKKRISTQAVVSWVVMPTNTLANQYKLVADEPGKGNPPGESAIFTGLCYASGQSGDTVWAAQVLPTGDLAADRQILQAIAPIALSRSYQKAHCIR